MNSDHHKPDPSRSNRFAAERDREQRMRDEAERVAWANRSKDDLDDLDDEEAAQLRRVMREAKVKPSNPED